MLTDDMAFRYCDPPALLGETVDRIGRGLTERLSPRCLENHLMEKWCITTLQDPAKEMAIVFYFGPPIEMPPYHLQIEKLIDDSGYVSPLPPPDAPEHVTLRFDLRYRIDAQLRERRKSFWFGKIILRERRMPYSLNKTESKGSYE